MTSDERAPVKTDSGLLVEKIDHGAKLVALGGGPKSFETPVSPPQRLFAFPRFSEQVRRNLREGREMPDTFTRVTPAEIDQALSLAGFEPMDTDDYDSFRAVFTRGACTLVVNKDATWACHRHAQDVRRLCCAGYTVASLLCYLTDYPVMRKRIDGFVWLP